MGASVICFLHHAFDLAQLFHQMQLRGQAAGRVHQHHVFAACFACAHRVKTDGGWVAAFLADDLYRIAVGPDHELLARCRAKGVRCGQQHAGPVVGEVVRELADGGGLARTVDAHHHDDGGVVRADLQWFLQGGEQLGQALRQQGFDG